MYSQLVTSISKGTIAGLSVYVYDMILNLSNTKSFVDAYTLGFSISTVDFLVCQFFHSNNVFGLSNSESKYINMYIVKPLLSAVVYEYFYNSYYNSKFSNNNLDNHSKNELYAIGALLSIFSEFATSPLLSMIGIKSIGY